MANSYLLLAGNVAFVPVFVALSCPEQNVQITADPTSDRGTLSAVDQQNGRLQEGSGSPNPGGSMRKENLQLNLQNRPKEEEGSKSEEEESKKDDYLYCEECRSFFIDKCEVHGPVVFISDTPVPLGITDRARKTLPSGLEVRHSDMSRSGLGVFNQGETIPVGAHFGPYQGDMTDKDKAMKSSYSWVLYKNGQGAEYIDAKRETHANWMRYVSHSHNEEQNLVAFQHQGRILFRCCRPIKPGEELLVSYAEEYAKNSGITFNYLWNNKSPTKASGNSDATQVFSCTLCPRSYTSQIFLHRHIKWCHQEEYIRLVKSSEIKPVGPTSSNPQQTSSTHLSHWRIRRDSDLERKYHCSKDGKSFTDMTPLQLHLSPHSGEKPYSCSECGRQFSKNCHLKMHKRIHTGEKPFKCSECGRGFTRRCHLQMHERRHTGEKPYNCLECGKSFSDQSQFKLHQRIHTGERPFHCSHCGKNFISCMALKRHQRIHTGEKPYYCLECGKKYALQTNLLNHQRSHATEKPYKCSDCGKGFTQKTNLKLHQRIHTGERPYICSECGLSFNQQSHLRQHIRIHTGEKPHTCSECGHSFTNSGTLKRHKCSNKDTPGLVNQTG